MGLIPREREDYGKFKAFSPELEDCILEVSIYGFGSYIKVLKDGKELFGFDTLELLDPEDKISFPSFDLIDYEELDNGYEFEFSPFIRVDGEQFCKITVTKEHRLS